MIKISILLLFVVITFIFLKLWTGKKKYTPKSLTSWNRINHGIVLLKFGKEGFIGRQYEWCLYPNGERIPEEIADQLRIVWYAVFCGEVDNKLKPQLK